MYKHLIYSLKKISSTCQYFFFSRWKRDHFILALSEGNILFVKNGEDISFENTKRLGYDANKAVDDHNNLLAQAPIIRTVLISPLRKNLWLSPTFTVVSYVSLNRSEVIHLYRFCQLMGGVDITVSRVSSVTDFLAQPHFSLILENYFFVD